MFSITMVYTFKPLLYVEAWSTPHRIHRCVRDEQILGQHFGCVIGRDGALYAVEAAYGW